VWVVVAILRLPTVAVGELEVLDVRAGAADLTADLEGFVGHDSRQVRAGKRRHLKAGVARVLGDVGRAGEAGRWQVEGGGVEDDVADALLGLAVRLEPGDVDAAVAHGAFDDRGHAEDVGARGEDR